MGASFIGGNCCGCLIMPETARIIGHGNNEQLQAQVDTSDNLQVKEGAIKGTNKVYEDTSFVVGDSPVTLDVNADMGRNARDGYIVCDGAGNILVKISRDGLTFDEQWTQKENEIVELTGLDIDKIRITHVTDSSYRVNVV